MEIIEVDDIIANRIDSLGIIEINKNLKNYPKLLSEVMVHELSHYTHNHFFQDFWLDMKNLFYFKNFFDWWKFTFENPKACLKQCLPYRKKGKVLYWDFTLLLFYFLFFIFGLYGGWLWLK